MQSTDNSQAVRTPFPRHEHILVVADDFTGACEVSLPWKANGYATTIALDPSAARQTTVHITDTNTRGKDPRAARATIHELLDLHEQNSILFKKIDSLWRGNISSEISAIAAAGFTLVIAGALPHLKRSVRNGVPLIAGIPLAQGNTWDIEPSSPPKRVAELCSDLQTLELPRPEVGNARWEADFLAALDCSQALIIDCETEHDLALIASFTLDRIAATRLTQKPIALIGTGALNAAVAAELASRQELESIPDPYLPFSLGTGAVRPLLAVVGSASGHSGQQLERARKAGLQVTERASELEPERPDGTFGILTVPPDLGDRNKILTELRHQAGNFLTTNPDVDLFLTGGETARAILDDLGVSTLFPLLQLEPGVVLCHTPDGRLIGSKPGTFGTADVLAHALSTMRTMRNAHQENYLMSQTLKDTRPYIAVTMGDGAGVGPEVTVGALLDLQAYASCRPVVIGDTYRLRLGAQALGVEADIIEIKEISEAVFIPGRINVIDPHLLSEDLEWGKESAEAGNAAYHYIRIACELGMKGEVQGICTAPLNKAALHSAGHIYPGHTELLAHFMGIEEVSMMLSTPKVKVIHVTTHIGLIDAIAKIEPGLVERTVRRGHDALVRAGISNPKIGVCAINPHAGENGLFGYGEEETKIIPALEKLRAAGIDAAGPLPADTAFFLAGRGDYDLIVAMYHDQGHGPVKVLGIEAGVNITVGLPVIRTSVDHGTAFDIAGTGVVEVGSMIEALRQAVNLASVPVS